MIRPMGRYVAHDLCLDCQTVLRGEVVCPRCGLLQVSPEADDLRRLLTAAEGALPSARAASRPAYADVGQPRQPSPSPMTTPLLPPMRPQPAARTLPAFSTPVVLLGLGATCVLVAAIVFVSVSWSDLSLAAKAAILLVVTGLVGGAAGWSLLKVLRGSAEAFATLFALLVLVDFAAAHTSGLAGLDGLSSTSAHWVASLLLLLSGGAWALAARNGGVEKLTGAQLAAASGLAGLAAVTFEQFPDWRTEYVALAWFALMAGIAILARRLLEEFALVSGIVALALFVLGWAMSLSRLIEPRTVAGLWDGFAPLGWLLCCAILGAASASRPVPSPLKHMSASLAAVGVALLLLRPLEGSSFDTIVAVDAAVALTLGVLGAYLLTRGPWHTAARVAAAGPLVLAALLLLPSAVEAVARAVSPVDRAWQLAETTPTVGLDSGLVRGSATVVALALVALAVSGSALLKSRVPTVWTGGLLFAASVSVVALRQPLPLWQVVAVLGGLAIACAAVALVRGSRLPAAASVAVAVLTLLAALGSELTTQVIALLLTGALTALTTRFKHGPARDPLAAGTVAMGALTLAAALALSGLGQDAIVLGLVLLGGLVFVGAQARRGTARLRVRNGLEVGAAAVMVVALGLAVDYVDLLLPVAMTLTGVALASGGILSADRRLLMVPASVLFAGASWVRLWVEDVTVLEAYTLPSALVLCASGVWRLRRTPESATLTALGPGLTLAFLPSLAAALPAPTSLRALLLGLSAVAVLLTGAWLRWAAPLVLGSATALLLVLVNVAPYATAVPRWVIFAVAGVGLLFLGVTWERRLRDARIVAAALLRLH